MFVDDFDYPGGAEYDYGQGVSAGWAYYNSTDNEIWSLDPAGVSFRDLSDGDWDSWVWTNYDESWLPIRTPGVGYGKASYPKHETVTDNMTKISVSWNIFISLSPLQILFSCV